MRYLNIFAIIFVFSTPFNTVSADALVLVHGFASNASSWHNSGINAVLTQQGWQNAGLPGKTSSHSKKFFNIELPAQAPLIVQANYLKSFLTKLRLQYPQDKISIAGHSAGGVVARIALLEGNSANVSTLITIASPHMGTPRTSQALHTINDTPFFCPGPFYDFVRSSLGGSEYDFLERSEGLLVDLLPAGYGGLLAWANQQPHPVINYHAVIRQGGDELVPAFSQDLNQVPALRGKAKVWVSRSGHSLNPGDGLTILTILSQR